MKLINPNPHSVYLTIKGSPRQVIVEPFAQRGRFADATYELADLPEYAQFVELNMLSRVDDSNSNKKTKTAPPAPVKPEVKDEPKPEVKEEPKPELLMEEKPEPAPVQETPKKVEKTIRRIPKK